MRLPFPARILEQHLAMLGKTGSGKSSGLRVVGEYQLAHEKRVIVIDPKGDWWGLKYSATGRDPGYPVILFGDFKEQKATDIRIHPNAGKAIAELVTRGNRPCVIGFRGWMPGQMTHFWIDFASTLFNARQPSGLYIIIDEVHNFAPKGKVLDPESGKCLHWTNRILSEGRGLGMTFGIASQRSQKVHNDTLDNCETLVAMRVTHPRSRDAVKEWIDGNGDPEQGKEVLKTLASLKRRQAWVWSPENEFGPTRIEFSTFETFDSFAPPTAQKSPVKADWSAVDLTAVQEQLAAVIAEAQKDDPTALRRRIVELERLQNAPAPPSPAQPDPEAIKRFVNAATAPLLKKLRQAQQASRLAIQKVNAGLDALSEIQSETFTGDFSIPLPAMAEPRNRRERPRLSDIERTVTQLPTVPAIPSPISAQPDGILTLPQRKILQALGELLSIGKDKPSRNMVAAWSGYSPIGGSFGNPIGQLRAKGLVDYPTPAVITLTAAGRATVGPTPYPGKNVIWTRIKETCSGPELKILTTLVETAGGETIPRAELAHKSGYSPVGGSFGNPIGDLKKKGLVEYPTAGMVKAADWLMEAI